MPPVNDKDPRVQKPEFQEFDDMVNFVLDKREAKKEEERKAKEAEAAKVKPRKMFDFLPF